MKTLEASVMIKGLPGRKYAVIYENRKIIIQFLLTVLFIYMAAWFIRHERPEIGNVKLILGEARALWMIAGVALVFVYIFLRALLYVTSFSSIGIKVSMRDSISLFLKRNFISVFLPAGGISSLIFFTSNIERKGISKSQIFFASSVNAFVGILTVVIVAIPAFLFVVTGDSGTGKWLALAGLSVMLISLAFLFYSIAMKTAVYRLIIKVFPKSALMIDEIGSHRIELKPFIYTILISLLVEVIGIVHVLISVKALGLNPSLAAAVMSYIIVVIFQIISPFLRGLGAIEVSMSYILTRFGLPTAEAIAVTMLFRFFEFWLPLVTGMLSFLAKANKLFIRILPAMLIFSLGLVNIISVLTPALPERLRILTDFLFIDIISISNSFVLVTGLLLLLTAVFMLQGLRSAWWLALGLSIISMIGHLTKGIDYEEASVALFVISALIATRKQYHIRHDPKLGSVGFQTAILSIAIVLVFGVIGFYFLDSRHFHADFSLRESLLYTLQNFFLVGSKNLVPADSFARDFLNLIRISGIGTMGFLVYTLARPYILKAEPTEEEKTRAASLVQKYGTSSLDYFKTYSDKLIFAPEGLNAFISYRVSKNFAVVLEDPVAENEHEMKKCIRAFSRFCYENSLNDVYYRVPKESLHIYHELSRKSLFIGQEAIVDLTKFTLEGGERKSLRNALNKVKAEGYTTHVYNPPLRDGLVQRLKAVSEEWLRLTGRHEIVFSQGMFIDREIKNQTVITVENREELVAAFLNIIPDHARNEGTYDLQRKTAASPNGVMDSLLTELFSYFKSAGIRYVNLGFAPMSGVDDPNNFPERSMKFAYEKIRSFSHYRGLRDYKEKFNPEWNDKYLVYSHDYDLLRIPAAISGAIKPR
ncbi:MAG TPA: phosphatidylglycerol lysyltransferase domain-containing protein [Bacteroidales bacterium]|nr:phosphatidylglycerol lysyltransferase domain-containing protein [Bacteroidales bacterium]